MIRAIVAIVLVAVVGGPPSHEASADFGRAGYVQAAPLLYVCIQDDAKVAVVDMAKAAVVRTIDLQKLGFPATAKPHYIVVEPDGSNWYVSLIGANKVVKFDAQDRVAASFDMETPGMLSFAAGAKLVVSRSMSAVNPPKRIAVLDRATMAGDEIDILFPRPHPVAVVGSYAYTASLGVNQLASIVLATEKVQIIDVPGDPHGFVQFAASPDGRALVASTEVSGQLMVFDLAKPAAPALKASIPLGKMVFDPVFTPDGKFVWVPVKMTNEVVVIDAATWKIVARITDAAFKQPHQVVFSPDGRTAFVTNNNKMDHMADPAHKDHAMPATDAVAALAVVDVASRKVTKAIPLGKNLTGMGTQAR